ncbi:EpsG family protein [Alloiococcus sp. CFN-8]|uniref:EpsG family protein n=1 Tax=Alloiococcus sp. CFN-8 TaxID=3416081 RepID=UPI003CEF916D
MSGYVYILVWIAACYLITNTVRPIHKERTCGAWEYRYDFKWALIIFLPIVVWCSLRTNFGDTEAYRKSFLELPGAFSSLFSYVPTIEKDKGFTALSIIIKSIIGNSDIFYFFIIAAIQGLCLVIVYRKYSCNYLMSIFLFIASTDYLSWMFNGMRQFLAAALLFTAIGLILSKRYTLAIIVTLLVSTIHGSALLMIPMIFIVQGKAWNKKTLLFILGVILAIVFVDQFTNILSEAIVDTQYDDLLTNGIWENDDGTSMFRVLVYAVPTLLSLVGRRIILKENNHVINLCTNMSILSTGLYIVSMFTSGIYIGRLPIYFSLYNYILLPWEIENIFTKKSADIMYLLTIAAYLLFYYLQMHMAWNLI